MVKFWFQLLKILICLLAKRGDSVSKINFNETNINRLITPNLSSCMNNLSTAIRIVKNLNIPYDFKYRSYLKSLDENLQKDLNSISTIYNSVKEDLVTINRICERVEQSINGIDNISIPLRQNPFK